jgi:hypothetical protein
MVRALAMLALILLVGCAGFGSPGPSSLPAVGAASWHVRVPALRGPSAPGHLYVVDLFGSTVYRFRLQNGIPSSSPENTITGLANPNSLAVGPDGDLYISDRNGVKVFAPGASGNALPLRVLPANYVARIAVDASGYLYAGVSGTPPLIAVYAPGAGGVDQPIQTIVAQGQESRVPDLGLATDAQGDLYASVDPGSSRAPSIAVYGTPTTNPTIVREPCAPELFQYFGSLAIGSGSHLYAARGNGVSVFRDTVSACPARPQKTFSATKPSISAIRGIAVGGNKLYVGDFLNQSLNTGAVFVFDTAGNPRRPVALLYGKAAQFATIDDVALGP